MGTKTERFNRAAGGFTLIEVMITIGILTFGLLSLAAMQIHAMHGSDRGRHATHAAAIAESKMEQLQQDAWASIGVTGGFVADPVELRRGQADGVAADPGAVVVVRWSRHDRSSLSGCTIKNT